MRAWMELKLAKSGGNISIDEPETLCPHRDVRVIKVVCLRCVTY